MDVYQPTDQWMMLKAWQTDWPGDRYRLLRIEACQMKPLRGIPNRGHRKSSRIRRRSEENLLTYLHHLSSKEKIN